jgi:uncharacterized membrane protein
MHNEPEERRSRLVPILAAVTAVLALVVIAVVVLYFTGVFDRRAAPAAATAAAAPTAADIGPGIDSDARTIKPPTAQTTDVPKASRR